MDRSITDKSLSVNLNEIMVFSDKGIWSKVLSKSGSHSVTLMCLSAGSDIDTHTSAKNGSVYVIKGKGSFTLFERKIALEPGVLISMPQNAPHSLVAHEDTAILLSLYG